MFDEELARHKKKKKRVLTGFLAVVGLLAIAVTIFFTAYITDYKVVGCHYEQEEQIIDDIFSTPMEQRFFYAMFENITGKHKSVNGLESYKVSFSPDLSVTVSVIENPLIGAIRCEDGLYYFDMDGFVMAKDIILQEAVPIVEGDGFENITLYGKIENAAGSLAEDILQLTQLLSDNSITADAIFYDEALYATITLGQVKVSLGGRENMTDKIAELCAILESGNLNSLKGTLHLETCGQGSSSYIFDRE